MFLIQLKLYVGCRKVTTEVCHDCVPIFVGLCKVIHVSTHTTKYT